VTSFLLRILYLAVKTQAEKRCNPSGKKLAPMNTVNTTPVLLPRLKLASRLADEKPDHGKWRIHNEAAKAAHAYCIYLAVYGKDKKTSGLEDIL
jgi:hypothetical protein